MIRALSLVFVPVLSLLPATAAQDPPADLLNSVRASLQRDPRSSPAVQELVRQRLLDLQLAQIVTQRLLEAGLSNLLVACRDGQVELRGQAANAELREHATELAAGVPGIVVVRNELSLMDAAPAQGAPMATLSADAAMAEPEPAAALDEVRLAELAIVAEGYADEPESAAEPFGFLTADGLAGRAIRVDLDHGLVRLRGEVNSTNAKTYAALAAEAVPGVQAVLNELVVNRASQEETRRLTLLVQKQIEYDPFVQAIAPMVLVQVRDGVVRLEGRVQDAGQRDQVEWLASRQAGVFAVDNRLEIEDDLVVLPRRRAPQGTYTTR